MTKLNRNQVKGISKLLSRNSFEVSEYCTECSEETEIENLNLVTGVCTRCKPSTIKLSKERLKELLRLSDD